MRAISILAVMCFHFGLPAFGGYVGVGVFFVISGYYLCSGDECLYRSGGHLIYFDHGHFSGPGSARAVLAYFPLIRRERAQ